MLDAARSNGNSPPQLATSTKLSCTADRKFATASRAEE